MFATQETSWIDRLDDMAPGEELSRMLAEVDRDQLDGYGRVVLLKARARQVAHLQAQFYSDVWSVAQAEERFPGEGVIEATSEEVQMALSCTRRAADRHLGLAYQLCVQRPSVLQALSEGRIDLSRARVICDRLAVADEEIVGQVLPVVLERAQDQTTGQIAARIDRLVVAADPEAARKRYHRSVDDRHVTLEQDSDGTATLTGFRLPADRALRAIDHLDQLARSFRIDGEARTMDQLRADILLDLLEGRQVSDCRGGRGVVDLRIDLTTLAGLNDQPADVPGWGPLIADVARRLPDEQTKAQWRVTVTDPDSHLPVWAGTTRRRPTAAQRRVVAAYSPTCLFKTCRSPATRADIDHNQPWSRGGPTTNPNLGPLCEHHHTVKDRGGWVLEQIQPGTYRWTSPLGHTYIVKSEPP